MSAPGRLLDGKTEVAQDAWRFVNVLSRYGLSTFVDEHDMVCGVELEQIQARANAYAGACERLTGAPFYRSRSLAVVCKERCEQAFFANLAATFAARDAATGIGEASKALDAERLHWTRLEVARIVGTLKELRS